MTKGGRIFGGIFTIIGSGISLLVSWVAFILAIFGVINGLCYYLTLAMGILGIVCGILMLVDKTAGAAIAVIIAVLMLAGVFLKQDMLGLDPSPIPLIIHIWVEPVMIMVGGIAGLAAGSD